MNKKFKIAVLGSGNMGTAIAQVVAKNGCQVNLWNHEGDLKKGGEKNGITFMEDSKPATAGQFTDKMSVLCKHQDGKTSWRAYQTEAGIVNKYGTLVPELN